MDAQKTSLMEVTPGQRMLLDLFPHQDAKELAENMQDILAKSSFFIEKEAVNQFGSFVLCNLASIIYKMALEYEAINKS